MGAVMELSAQMEMSEGAGPSHDPCCDECDDTNSKECNGSASCMTACGKLPVQLGSPATFARADLGKAAVFHLSDAWHGRVDSPPIRSSETDLNVNGKHGLRQLFANITIRNRRNSWLI